MQIVTLLGSEGIERQIRWGGQDVDLALQCYDSCGVDVCFAWWLRGVYCVSTSESCPAKMSCNSITGGLVTPPLRTRPVREEGNRLIVHSSLEPTRRREPSRNGHRGEPGLAAVKLK